MQLKGRFPSLKSDMSETTDKLHGSRGRRAGSRRTLTPDQVAIRKRIFAATFVTCIALAFIGGTIHVLMLGSHRLLQMRSLATYDVSNSKQHILAAGEDITRHQQEKVEAEQTKPEKSAYTVVEAKALLTPAQWSEVNTMVTIPGGDFTMGTNQRMANAGDKPRHQVSLPAFKIDKYPVTNAQYALFVAETGHRPPQNWDNGLIPRGKKLHPVTMIDWYDARDYAKWAGKRLPTEAEWEKAARGTDGRRWPWGNHMNPKFVNTYYNVGDTTPVTKYKDGASPFGVVDMAGNVSEWTSDDFTPYPGSDAPDNLFKVKLAKVMSKKDKSLKVADMVVKDKGHYKVLRGGSWKSDPFSTEAYHRDFQLPNLTSNFYGFRTAQDADASSASTTQSMSYSEKSTSAQ